MLQNFYWCMYYVHMYVCVCVCACVCVRVARVVPVVHELALVTSCCGSAPSDVLLLHYMQLL